MHLPIYAVSLALFYTVFAAAHDFEPGLSFVAREYIDSIGVREALSEFSTRELVGELKKRGAALSAAALVPGARLGSYSNRESLQAVAVGVIKSVDKTQSATGKITKSLQKPRK
ncbi:hypothetical protein DFP72DRAFT_865204 [Ephemerocybe angulata]|uniref:Uncharacterized protein n=1 Tax=Ephemerocybe angulata TaxID=980116 RepID=A0A8H6IHZ5_9AGAR|nr:hypothetical protein DFP72DRAFT_865204 [Tulosesus angulatus]